MLNIENTKYQQAVNSEIGSMREKQNHSNMSIISEDEIKPKAVYMNVNGHELMSPNKFNKIESELYSP